MNKANWDQLYHSLREVFNSRDPLEKAAARGITRHLFGHVGGNYRGLLDFSTYYGERFLLVAACNAVAGQKLKFGRIVEFGAGMGWLSKGMGRCFEVPNLQIDKRDWTPGTMIADLEAEEGIRAVLEVLRPDDLIVMSDFLHCLDSPGKIMTEFSSWDMLTLEYLPRSQTYSSSYVAQLRKFGATPFRSKVQLDEIFLFRRRYFYDLDPYILTVVRKLDGKEAKTKDTAKQD